MFGGCLSPKREGLSPSAPRRPLLDGPPVPRPEPGFGETSLRGPARPGPAVPRRPPRSPGASGLGWARRAKEGSAMAPKVRRGGTESPPDRGCEW